MRLANLLVDQNGIRVIDFDDCGYGWFMYDFAATISFIEDDPRILEFKSAWLEGYLTQRRLSAEDIHERSRPILQQTPKNWGKHGCAQKAFTDLIDLFRSTPSKLLF